MRLADLDPKWLLSGGRRVGLVFLCPHCRACYLSCFAEGQAKICGDDEEPDGVPSQYQLFRTVLSDDQASRTVPYKRNFAWGFSPPIAEATFDSLSVTPSLDASAAGCWHGFVTSGGIVGGIPNG